MFPYHGQKIKNNNTTPEQSGDNTQDGNENPGENNPGTGTVTTNPKPSNDTNNSSTNNEIILNKEELTTNISRKQNSLIRIVKLLLKIITKQILSKMIL